MSYQNCDRGDVRETPTQRLASLLLRQDVTEYVADKRAVGTPWRFIARDLYERTNGQVDVTHETLRQWHEAAA